MMIKCARCAEKFTQGKICTVCAKAYCEKEDLSKCPFCKAEIIDASVVEETFGERTVQWLLLKGTKIGLVDFEEIPTFLPQLIWSTVFEETDVKIIILPSKKSSWKFAQPLVRKSGVPWEEYVKRLDKSRYTIFYDPEKKERYALLNLEAIPADSLGFLLSYILQVFSQIAALKEVKTNIIERAFAETLFNYVNKLGIPFVTRDEDVKILSRILPEGILQSYAEYSALRKLLMVNLNKSSELIRHKIDLLFSGIEYEYLDAFPTIYNFLGTFVKLTSLLVLAQENEALKQYVDPIFYDKNEECKEKLKEFPDIVKCIDTIVEGLSGKEDYASYQSYLETVASVLRQVFSALQPRYLRIAEVATLFEISEEYKRKIEKNEIPYLPKLGSLKDFCRLLRKIFENREIYPELRIIAGQSLLDTLEFVFMVGKDFTTYFEGVNLVQELATLIEKSVPEISQRLGKGRGLRDPVGYHDACLALVAFSQFALMLNDKETASKLLNLSKRIAYEHHVLSMTITHAWKDFVETHDYQKLLYVHKSFLAIDYSEHEYMESSLKVIGHLSSAVFESEARQTDFDEAEKNALEMMEPPPSTVLLQSYSDQAIRSSQAMYHLVRLFRHMLEAYDSFSESSLKNALLESHALSESISGIDPLNLFALKTEILYALFLGNFKVVQESCNKLKEQVSQAPLIQKFIGKVEKWLSESTKLEGRRFLMSLELDINEQDPWERVFGKIVAAEMSKDAEKNIVGADAIVFVEGITDAGVLEEFARKIVPRKRIAFMDVEGFTNMNYFSEAKLAKSLKMPIFTIFDGDTSTMERKKRVKQQILSQITLPEDRILTLRKNSIEDYLLVPSAIKRAFPSVRKSVNEIQIFFKVRQAKRNKKQVLEDLFKDMGLGKYDREKAFLIASKMKKSEIHDEIVTIFDLFAH